MQDEPKLTFDGVMDALRAEARPDYSIDQGDDTVVEHINGVPVVRGG